MAIAHCTGEQTKRIWRPDYNNLKELEKRFKRSIVFFSRKKFGPDGEGEDMDQEQVDEQLS